jgi:hypothetical protein
MLTRIEFTEGSMSTRSFSFLEIVRGLRRTSFDVLCRVYNGCVEIPASEDIYSDIVVEFAPAFNFRFVVSFYHLCVTC